MIRGVSDADATRVFFVENEECVGSWCSFRSGVVPMDTLFQSRRQHVGIVGEEPLCATQGLIFDKTENFEVVSFSSIFICRVCPSSIWAPFVVASEAIGCVRESHPHVISIS